MKGQADAPRQAFARARRERGPSPLGTSAAQPSQAFKPLSRAEAPRDLVLVVDDSSSALQLLTGFLEQAGMAVLGAEGGADALATVENVTPDAVVLEAAMPLMDGFETARRLRQRRGMLYAPIILMTGLYETEQVVRGFAAGGTDFVTKPIVPDELLACVRAHLGNARRTQAAFAALDAAGRHHFVADQDGSVLWATPKAFQLIVGSTRTCEAAVVLPPEILEQLREGQQAVHAARQNFGPSPDVDDGSALVFDLVGAISPGEFLLRVTRSAPNMDERRLRQRLALTQRESEVLLWIAQGKSNRDIAAILTLSPRTVNKHLEQIYAKLDVENRAAAAALATRILETVA